MKSQISQKRKYALFQQAEKEKKKNIKQRKMRPCYSLDYKIQKQIDASQTSVVQRYVLPEGKSWLIHYRTLSPEIQWTQEDFNRIWLMHPFQMGEIKIMGKKIQTPRYQMSYEKDYHFSGLTHQAKEFPDEPKLLMLKNWVQEEEKKRTCNENQVAPNQMLINWYENLNHYIGWHSDDERQLDQTKPIYSFSFGSKRRFQIRSKYTREKLTFYLTNNSLLVMGGETQKFYHHQVPKVIQTEIKNGLAEMGQRINVTFRYFK